MNPMKGWLAEMEQVQQDGIDKPNEGPLQVSFITDVIHHQSISVK